MLIESEEGTNMTSLMIDMSIREYMEILRTDAPAPGGGGVSGIGATQGVALTLMVTELTIGKEKYKEVRALNEKVREECLNLYKKLLLAADEDKETFLELSKAYKLPKETEEQKETKRRKLGEASLGATRAPFSVMELSLEAIRQTDKLVGKSNKMASSDLGVAAINLYSACKSAWLNVKINLPYLNDIKKAKNFQIKGEEILKEAKELSDSIYKKVEENL